MRFTKDEIEASKRTPLFTTVPENIIDQANQDEEIVVDVEHDPTLDPINATTFSLWGVSFCTSQYYGYFDDPTQIAAIIANTKDNCRYIGHHIKYDIKCLISAGYLQESPELADTMTAYNLVDEEARENQLGLKYLSKTLFGVEMAEFKDAAKTGHRSEEFINYALADSKTTFRLWQLLKPKLDSLGLTKYFNLISMRFRKVIIDIERNGMSVDPTRLTAIQAAVSNEIEALEKDIKNFLGDDINLNSGQQLNKRLFQDLRIKTTGLSKTPKTGLVQINEDNLTLLSDKYPVTKKLLHRAKLRKMLTTYVEPLLEQHSFYEDGRIHPTLWQESNTGRTRSSNPNSQNIPSYDPKTDISLLREKQYAIKHCFDARPGFLFGCGDLSQIELRMMAHISQDPRLMSAYLEWTCNKCNSKGSSEKILHFCPKCKSASNEKILKDPSLPYFWHGLDLHSRTANNIPALKGDRQKAKIANFSLIYLASPWRLSQQFPEFDYDQWKEVSDGFFNYYSGVHKWHLEKEVQLNQTLEIRDIFNRRRLFDRSALKKELYKHTLNQFVNFPVQASSGGLMFLGIIKAKQKLQEAGYWNKDVYFTNMVHDELDFEVRQEVADPVCEIISREIENAVQLTVPVRIDLKLGKTWLEAKGA